MADNNVKIKEPIWLGFCVGLGFGLAGLFYALIGMVLVVRFFDIGPK